MTLSWQVIEPGNRAVDQPRNLNLPLSPAVRGGDFVFLSGMAAIDPATGEPAHGTVAAETRQILTNMGELLKAADSSLANAEPEAQRLAQRQPAAFAGHSGWRLHLSVRDGSGGPGHWRPQPRPDR